MILKNKRNYKMEFLKVCPNRFKLSECILDFPDKYIFDNINNVQEVIHKISSYDKNNIIENTSAPETIPKKDINMLIRDKVSEEIYAQLSKKSIQKIANDNDYEEIEDTFMEFDTDEDETDIEEKSQKSEVDDEDGEITSIIDEDNDGSDCDSEFSD